MKKPKLHAHIQLCILDFERPMRVQILALKKILSMLQRKKSTKNEIIKSLTENGFKKEDSENALRKLVERDVIYEYDYASQKKRYVLKYSH